MLAVVVGRQTASRFRYFDQMMDRVTYAIRGRAGASGW